MGQDEQVTFAKLREAALEYCVRRGAEGRAVHLLSVKAPDAAVEKEVEDLIKDWASIPSPLLPPLPVEDPAPGPACVVLEELALRRYAQRSQSGEVEFEGTRMAFRTSQALCDDQGEYRGTAFVTISGRRIFGGGVELASTPAIELTGPISLADAAYLRGLGSSLSAVLQDLCSCGNLRTSCDCCPACEGRGTTAGAASAESCTTCGGRGYQPQCR
jgi:hypothetical protein